MKADFPPTVLSKLNMSNILKAKFSQTQVAASFTIAVVRGPGKNSNKKKSLFGSKLFLYSMLNITIAFYNPHAEA